MKLIVKKLYVLLVMMAVSVGAWADDFYLSADTWYSNVESKTQNVLKISLCKENGGALQSAINTITADGWNLNGHSLTDFKVVYIDLGNGQPNDAFAMNDADIAALSNLNFETIDLQDAYYLDNGEKTAFTFTNSYVQNLILPDNWTKEEVNTCAQSVRGVDGNLNAALSQGINENDGNPSATAYVCNPGTLAETVSHIFLDNKSNTKISVSDNTISQYGFNLSKSLHLTISGNASARDFNGSGKTDESYKFAENGHFNFDKEADETSFNQHAAVGGGNRSLQGDFIPGAWPGGAAISLDLSDVIIEDEFCNDLNLSMSNLLGVQTKRVLFPTYAGFKTIPADCLYGIYVKQILLPPNIQVIRTRAFPSVDHLFTSGSDPTVKYDNGFHTTDGETLEGFLPINSNKTIKYGSYTFPVNLKLIETNAFMNTEPHVKDVYCLSIEAPECHVDAFNIAMYAGYGGYGGAAIDGMVTRDSYKNGDFYITMLHYPRQCETPDIQRYTDPTRQYSIATAERDGKGATLYFPTFEEFLRAYKQGTYGYVWNAWNPVRYNGEYGYGIEQSTAPISSHSYDGQIAANKAFLENPGSEINKSDRSFYDVTENGELEQPEGLTTQYYDVIWEGKQLYPKAETTGTGEYKTVEDLDENGNRQYDADNITPGEYIKVGTYTETTGTLDETTTYYVRDYQGTGVFDVTNTPNGSEAYYSDPDGTTSETPCVGAGFYYECGSQNVYSDAVYAPVSGVDTYYTQNGDEYTESKISFWNTMYYNPQEDTRTSYIGTTKIVSEIDTYYMDESGETIAEPAFVNNIYGNSITIYYKDGDTYKQTEKFKTGVTKYYVKFNWSQPDQYEDQTSNLSFTSTVYYPETKTGIFFEQTNYWLPEYPNPSDYYTSESLDNQVASFDGKINGTYYYATGTAPKYCSAAGEEYNENVTYYTDNTGTNVATSITFDKPYYYEKTTYTYRPAPDSDTDKKHYSLTVSHVAKETALNEPDEYRIDNDFYSVRTKQIEIQTVTKSNDYRGWHQFVLAGYATNSTEEFEPYRTYIKDNDWWTICLPFDLTKADLIKLFGDENNNKIPYLSKLTYVVRDVENKRITLNFSKNLLLYKEVMGEVAEGADAPIHGVINEDVEVAGNDIVLHKGVPYLIRPNIEVDEKGNVIGTRQFDIYKNKPAEGALYERIHASLSYNAETMNNIIYAGEYTVPAYVVNNSSEGESVWTGVEKVPFTMGDGTVFEFDATGTISYEGNDAVPYQISTEYCYTFVGTFFLSLMPKDSYFLGWDSKKNKAAFWYNKVQDKVNWTWNNETGIIMPNFVTSSQKIEIHEGTSTKDPARWEIDLKLGEKGDGFDTTSAAKNYIASSRFGFEANLWDDNATAIIRIDGDSIESSNDEIKGVYSLSGQYMGNSVEGLQKGIYIVNGKKMVIK